MSGNAVRREPRHVPSDTRRAAYGANAVFAGSGPASALRDGDGDMATREERAAANEAVARDINESIQAGRMAGEGPPDRSMLAVCECAHSWCEAMILLDLGEYATLRRRPNRFAVIPEHVVPDVEDVVAEHGNFVVVAKRGGVARS